MGHGRSFLLALAGLLLAVAPNAVRAAEALYSDAPVWSSPVEDTRAVALGDVDGDGDLDLVRAAVNRATTLWLNVGGVFATTPAWSGPVELTQSVALGDVDGDGDLDLVRGNFRQAATLYLNRGGVFEAIATWRGPDEATRAIALGDVDGDGDLDLVRGNLDQGSTFYRNVGGRFESSPSWTSPPAATYAVALGDVSGDGRLDLVLGNFGEASRLFLGSGTAFAATSAWSGPVENTRGLALGDIDADGDLDLVRGNLGEGATLTLNSGASFAAAPAWTSPPESTWAVALGDIDGDGRLDLARGNSERGSTAYLGQGAAFASVPSWTGPVENTHSVALADLDGDGDLDLVRGNLDQASTVYANITSPFAPAPVWTGRVEDTRAMALGDVDRDGDLDLVRGNVGSETTFYRNDGESFVTTPVSIGRIESTVAVVLGDVDGDGDLDLVRGNYDERATLYRWNGTAFAAAPESTGRQESTVAVALGDLDGDGDLDLVRGNLAQQATLYRNVGGTFAATPDWSGAVEATRAIALGDVDRDGDLDLVRGNLGEGATLYLNRGGTFGSTPDWTGPAEQTASVALGDVDGDGDLDLLRGNLDQGATLYRNTGLAFESTPFWIGPVEPTAGVALADLDADGDLDLVRANLSQGASVYLGRGGAFDVVPAGIVSAASTGALAIGDFDRDGDADLVLGPGVAFANRSPWIAATGLARQLPNDPAHLRRVTTRAAGPNDYRVSFLAVDDESDPMWIVGGYQFEGSGAWQTMTLASTGPLATSPTGVAHELAWDVTRIAFDSRPVTIRLRALSPPRRAGDIAFVPSYLHDAGRVVPSRPALEVSPALLAFPTVTVGDTVAMTFMVRNTGNRDLVITAIELPVPELTIEAAAGLTIGPDTSRTLVARLAPLRVLPALGPIRIRGNDPTRPIAEVAVTTDVRDLAFTTQLLAVAPELPLGESATVLVTPGPGVRIESGHLFHRSRGETSFPDSSELVRQGASFIALVPSQQVTERGLEYYVRVENSGVARTDPLDAPDSVFFHPVASPLGFEARPIPDLRGEFPAGQDIQVIASLLPGSEFVDGTLYYRAGGSTVYDSAAFSPVSTNVAPTALIPAEIVGPRGIEYWARVQTLRSTLVDPERNPRAIPKILRVNVDRVAEPAPHAGGRFRLVSVPIELDLPPTASLEALLSDQTEFGPPDVTRWRAFRYEPALGDYLEVTRDAEDPRLFPAPGRGFWLVAAEANAIDTAPIPGRSTTTETSFSVPLGPGWNQVGNPFTFPVAWSDVRVVGTTPFELEPPVAWDEVGARYRDEDVAVLRPFEAYWVWNPSPDPAALYIPPRETTLVSVGSHRSTQPSSAPTTAKSRAWSLGIHVACGERVDAHNRLGVDPNAASGRDPLDRTDPPLAPGAGVSLYFVDPEVPGAAPRTVDLRSALGAEGWRWPFDVVRAGSDRAAEDARLAFVGLNEVPPEIEIRLVDRVLARSVDPRGAEGHAFVVARRDRVASASEARFEIVAGTPDYVARVLAGPVEPWHTRFLSIAPSPMASAATIRFELARSSTVSIEAFDVAGRRVAALLDATRAAGRHELSWSGRDAMGRRLAPGLYLLRLTAGQERVVSRIVLAP